MQDAVFPPGPAETAASAGLPSTAGLPPSAELRREPEVPVRPDFAERWGDRFARFRGRHPRLVRRTARAYALLSWLALAVLVVAVVGVPSMRPALAVGLGLLVMLGQLVILSRSRTVSFAACGRAFVFGALLAVPIGLAEGAVAASLGLSVDDPFAVVYLAGPIEELLKLTPLLLLVVFARHRVRRFAVVDFCLLAAATGAGFQLAEDAVRRVTAPPNALVTAFETPVGGQYAWTHLFPGWVDWGFVRFPGHAVLTGLVGLGIGLAIRLSRRYGRVVWLLPAGCFILAVLDHMGWADAVYELISGHVLAWPVRLVHSLTGSGHATGWLLLVLLLAAVVLDFRAVRATSAMLPALPGATPAGRLPREAETMAVRARRTVPDDAAPVFHRLVGGLGAVLVAYADALAQIVHEGLLLCVAARRGPMVFFSALRLVRDRRELAQAIFHAAGRRRRDVPSRADLQRRCGLLESTLLLPKPGRRPATATATSAAAIAAFGSAGVVIAGVLASMVRTDAGGTGDPIGPAFVATVSDELTDWWWGLTPAGQILAPLGTLGLLVLLGGIWALPAGLSAAGGTAGFLREPGRATREFLSNLTAGQMLYYGFARGLGLVVPESARRVLGGSAPARDVGGGMSARLTYPPWQLQKRYAHCGPLFGLPAAYTHQHGEQLRRALQEFVDAPGTVTVRAGRYRGKAAVIHYDPARRIAVIFRPGREFWSAWRLTPAQYHDLLTLGTL